MNRFITGLLALACAGAALAEGLVSAAPEGAAVYFITPQDGEVVTSPVTVRFGLSGMGVAPAGIDQANTGHHHLLLDEPQLPAAGTPLPATAQIIHFGGGQTETVVELPPGTHTLQLLLGNYAHVPHTPPVLSPLITITVK
jgi:hypothetical protein